MQTEFDFDKQVKERFDNLEKDLAYIDLKINQINQNIATLQSNIEKIKNIIRDIEDNKLRSYYYNIQNEIYKILSMYDSNLQALLDLRFKYRKEQDELTLRNRRYLEYELVKLNSEVNKTNDSYFLVLDNLVKLLQQQKNTDFNFEFSPEESI